MAIPFGYGMSYTSLGLGNLEVMQIKQEMFISVDVRNIGLRDSAEVVQVYLT
jgi:hypothetical protein